MEKLIKYVRIFFSPVYWKQLKHRAALSVTDNAWGYRVVGRLNYNNVFAGVNVMPQISWKHDVDGVSPTPEFNEGRQALGLGVDLSYKETYKLGVSYTNFLDSGDFDVTRDRDFVSLSASVTF